MVDMIERRWKDGQPTRALTSVASCNGAAARLSGEPAGSAALVGGYFSSSVATRPSM
jgi:hypothetical protein